MANIGVTNNSKVLIDGKTPIKFNGQNIQWFDNWLDSLFIGSDGGVKGIKVNLNFAGNLVWMGNIRFSGNAEMQVTVKDTSAKGDHFIDSMFLSHGGSNVQLKNMSFGQLRTGRGDDTVVTGAGHIGQLVLGIGDNKATTGTAWIDSITAGDGDDVVNTGDGGVGQVLLNHGNNKVTTGKGHVDSIVMRDGDDEAIIGVGTVGSVNLGSGDNKVTTTKGWVDSIVTRGGNDQVTVGSGGVEFVSMGDGDDLLTVSPLLRRDDLVTVQGGKGSDTVNFSKITKSGVSWEADNGFVETRDGKFLVMGFENVIGTGKSDDLTGNDSINVIEGEKGNDRITGAKGADELTGGLGADHFIYQLLSDSTAAIRGRDLITDFKQAQKDKIDLSEIDAIPGGAVDRFVFIGEAGFSKTKGELRFERDGDTTFVYADIKGNGKADFAIEFDGSIAFKQGDFLL
jgi:Ca2+-binding RTX toxin-like protein